MPVPRPTRPPDELRALAEEHLAYEIGMLHDTAQDLASASAHPEHVRNALIESCIVHVRNLIDFLWPEKPWADDVLAADFYPSPEAWAAVAPAFPAVLLPARARAGKEIAHLTYVRLAVTPEEKRWQFVAMANALLAALEVFVRHAPPPNIGSLANAVH